MNTVYTGRWGEQKAAEYLNRHGYKTVGMTVGQEKELNVTFPENYVENLAGKDVVFKVKLNSLTVAEYPELDDEFAKDVSEFDTIDEYKADMTIEQELSNSTAEQMNKNQREYYLREELKIIQKELGDGEDAGDDAGEYKNRILALNLADKETEEKLLKEARNLAKQPFGSAEGAVIRSYLDTCLSLPWNTRTEETLDVAGARKMLDEDHYGLDKVKKRILEYLAVRQLTPDVKGGLLCLVGPPGTGKTSIALSVARATNRKLVRISLGGVHDL